MLAGGPHRGRHELPLHAVETAFGVQLREDAVMAQALSALVTAFTHRVDADLVADRIEVREHGPVNWSASNCVLT